VKPESQAARADLHKPMHKFLALLALLMCPLAYPSSLASAAPSQTPQVHYGGRSPALKNVLLSTGDIEGIPEGPLNVTMSKINDTSGLYQDPDPRLPCGRKAPNFNAKRAVEEQFSIPQATGIEAVTNLKVAQIQSLFNQYDDDIRVGCSYKSKTNTGSTQTSTLVKRFPMPKLTSHALGVVVVVNNDGKTFGAYEMTMSENTRVAALSLIANTPVRASFVGALARVAEKRLLGQLGT
jgi:hypothetical protein